MMFSFLRIIFRGIWHNGLSSAINILGLSISISCCIFVYVLVKHETTFDDFHQRANQIYRIVFEDKTDHGVEYTGSSAFALAPALRNDFPNLETVTQIYSRNNAVVEIPQQDGIRKLFAENELTYADTGFFKTFDFAFITGDNRHLLSVPDQVIISRNLADKYFGSQFHSNYNLLIGKTIIVNKAPYQISAIMENMPRNSNVASSMILPFVVFANENQKAVNDWRENFSNSYTFVTLPKDYAHQHFEKDLIAFKNKYLDKEMAAREIYHAQPLSEVHTDTRYGGTSYATPTILLLSFIALAVIVLLTSCINFINMATAQLITRAREIGVRKTLGGRNWQLILRFMTETLMLVLIASLIALILSKLFLNAFNQYLSFLVIFDLHFDFTLIFFLTLLVLLVTFLAGFYPVKVMTGYKPAEVLKNGVRSKSSGFTNRFSIRKSLIAAQIIVTQLLIICTIVVASQIRYFYDKDPGYRKAGILIVDTPSNDQRKTDLFRNEVMNFPGVKNISFSSGPPTSAANSFGEIRIPSLPPKDNISTERKFVDENYLQTFNIKLIAGRDLQRSDKVALKDSSESYNVLVNEKAVKALGFRSPDIAIGKRITVNDKDIATIVGVTSDFDNASLQQDITPVLMFNCADWVGIAGIEMSTANLETLRSIQKTWEALYPEEIFNSMTLNDYIKDKGFYLLEDIMYKGFKTFVLLAIVIGCMGLYGLVSFLALQRRKEIGIRKVLGASSKGILFLFSKEFARLTLIAFLIAAPIAYYAMNMWLQTFANRIRLQPGSFIIGLMISLAITLITIGYQSVRASLANPVESLRTE